MTRLAKISIEEKVILFRINLTHDECAKNLDGEDYATALYDCTRGVWHISNNEKNAEYAFAVYHGKIVEVYKIENWHNANTTEYKSGRDATHLNGKYINPTGRYEFTGEVAPNSVRDKYINKDLAFPLKQVFEYVDNEYQKKVINGTYLQKNISAPTTPSAKLKHHDGVSLENKNYTEIWDYLDVDTQEEIDIIEKAKKVFSYGEEVFPEKPRYNASVLLPDKTEITVDLLWQNAKCLLFLTENAEDYYKAMEYGFNCFLINQDFSPENLFNTITR